MQRDGSEQIGAEGIEQCDIVVLAGLQPLRQGLAHAARGQQAAKKRQAGPVAKGFGLQGQVQ